MTTEAILDGLYALLVKEGTGALSITCKTCGKTERGFVPMVYIAPDCHPHERIVKEEYNRMQKKALADGDVECWECATKTLGL
jgi:hypothetical protein